MTKHEAVRQTHQENVLLELGFTRQEAEALRRISMTLHRWNELECGDSNEYAVWAIERDERTEKPFMVRYSHRPPYSVTHTPIADREGGAKKRLKAIIESRNKRAVAPGISRTALGYYIQGDPRGAALYIIRPGDVPDGKDVNSYYTRGVVVY